MLPFLFCFFDRFGPKRVQTEWADFYPGIEMNPSSSMILEGQSYTFLPIAPLLVGSFYVRNCQFSAITGTTGCAIMYTFTTTKQMSQFIFIRMLIEDSFITGCYAEYGGAVYVGLYNFIAQIPNAYLSISKVCLNNNNSPTGTMIYCSLTPTPFANYLMHDSSFIQNGNQVVESTGGNVIQYATLDIKRNNISNNYAAYYTVIQYTTSDVLQVGDLSYNSFAYNDANIGTIIAIIPRNFFYQFTVSFEYCNILFNTQSMERVEGLIIDDITTTFKHCAFYRNTASSLFTSTLYTNTITIEDSYIDESTIFQIGNPMFIKIVNRTLEEFLNEIDCLNTRNCQAVYDTLIIPPRTLENTPAMTTPISTPESTKPLPSANPSPTYKTITAAFPGISPYDNINEEDLQIGSLSLPAFVGILIASFVALVIIVFLVVYFVRKRKLESEESATEPDIESLNYSDDAHEESTSNI